MPEKDASPQPNSGADNDRAGEVVPADQNPDQNAVDAARQQYKPTWGESFFSFTKALIIRALIIYFVSSFFRKPQTDPNVQSATAGVPKVQYPNLYENGTFFDMYVYISESDAFKSFDDPNALVWHEQDLVYGDWYGGPNSDGTRQIEYSFTPSEKLKNNGSIYLHVYTVKNGMPLVPKNSKNGYEGNYVSYARKMLNIFKVVRYKKTHNLLTGTTSASEIEIQKADKMKHEILSHWHPNLTINMITDQTNWVHGQVPPPLDEYIDFLPAKNAYKPVVYLNDFWNLKREFMPINSTVEQLELRLTYQPLSLFKWQLYLAQSMRKSWTSSIFDEIGETDEDDSDQDTLKETLLETNPYLLGMTLLISILHSIFEFLAFKNDIQFWNNRKSLEGLSVRSVFFNVFQSLIVLLYVFDNETNTVVRISCFIGLCIEIWKINKVMDIKINREDKLFGILPRISCSDKGSYVESSTKEYDRHAFKYLSWALFPLLGGYAVYSLTYMEHKGWYSWVLSMLYGFLLTFGFIMMTPQLFINYKLKSVAHLPWRMMSYKFLNTFIDDIFAFVIKMPTLYRLGCFRDDIVFIIYLYQRWIYKTDLSRVNEFGFSGEDAVLAIEKTDYEGTKDEQAKKTD